MSAGLVPGMSLSRNWQTEDDVAIRLTEVTRGLESLLNTASHEGGFMTTALLLATEDGERAAQALVPQAFHGPNVPTPVLTVPGAAALRDHALAFRPSLAPDGDPFRINLLWSKWGTLLTPGHAGGLHQPQPVRGGHGGHHPGEAAAVGVLPGTARRGGARPPGQPRDRRPDRWRRCA